MELSTASFIRNNGTAIGIFLLFCIPVVSSVYYAIQLPVSFDEACTFLLFSNQNFEAAYAHYPAPNNHVFHSLLTILTQKLPYLSKLFKLRISAILFNAITLFVIYKFISSHFDKKMALVVTAISSMLFLNIYYSYMSRGYSLVNLFFIVTLFCSFNIMKGRQVSSNWAFFCIFSILGFYTIPAFLYPFVTLNVLLFVNCPQNYKRQFFANLLVLLVVFLLYYPIIANDGIQAITNNRFVKPIGLFKTIKSIPFFCLTALEEITGIHWLALVLILLLSFFKILKGKVVFEVQFMLILLFAPVTLFLVQRVVPYPRVFNYYSTIIIIFIFLPYQISITKLKTETLVIILLGIQLLLLVNFNCKIKAFENRDQAINITASHIIPKIIGNKKYLFSGALLYSNLEFELISKGYKNYTIKYLEGTPMSFDTIKNYDYVVLGKEIDQTKYGKPFIQTPYYSIYKR